MKIQSVQSCMNVNMIYGCRDNIKSNTVSFGDRLARDTFESQVQPNPILPILQYHPELIVDDISINHTDEHTELFRSALLYKAQEKAKPTLSQYDNDDDMTPIARNNKKINAYDKICKKLIKSPTFNPNADFLGSSLVEDAIRCNDEKMALAIIRHRDFKAPEKFVNAENEQKYKKLEKKANNIFYRIFC